MITDMYLHIFQPMKNVRNVLQCKIDTIKQASDVCHASNLRICSALSKAVCHGWVMQK